MPTLVPSMPIMMPNCSQRHAYYFPIVHLMMHFIQIVMPVIAPIILIMRLLFHNDADYCFYPFLLWCPILLLWCTNHFRSVNFLSFIVLSYLISCSFLWLLLMKSYFIWINSKGKCYFIINFRFQLHISKKPWKQKLFLICKQQPTNA